MKLLRSKLLPLSIYATLIFTCSNAQSGNNDHWEVYLASYDNGPGSTLVNFSLYDKSPIKKYPFIVITGVTFTNCTSDGFPTDEEFTKLYTVSDSLQACVGNVTKSINAGTFTYQCQRLDYIYVDDTTNIRQQLAKMYTANFKQYQYYIKIKNDEKWEAYRTFLYPNEETMEDISNSKVVLKLQEAGDKLDKPRLIDHWLYFKTANDRDSFVVYAKSNGFAIVEKTTVKGERPFCLHIAKNDKAELGIIDKITLALRRQAKKFNGVMMAGNRLLLKSSLVHRCIFGRNFTASTMG